MSLFFPLRQLFSGLQPQGKGRKSRRQFESLESRSLLAADLSINSFTSDGVNLVVDFSIAQEETSEFSIAIYRSFDGVTPDELLVSRWIDAGLGIGSHQVIIPAAFTDLVADYELFAVIDDGSAIMEAEEGNNQASFGGGAFVDAAAVLQVHGTMAGDIVTIYDNGYLNVDYNNTVYSYLSTEIAAIAVRTHGNQDYVLVDYTLMASVKAFGGDDNDFLLGGAGNDLFFGGNGDDYLIGGGGNDLLFGEAGFDALYGDEGDDYLIGGEDLDLIYGGDGADTIGESTGGSNYNGYGDTIDGGEDDDLIFGTNSADLVNGGAGNDVIFGLGGNDQLFGDIGDDYLSGGEGDDQLDGGFGSDQLSGGAGADILGDSWDSGYAGYGDMLDGGEGDDVIYGTSGEDIIYGGDGNDTIYGLSGNDQLFGEQGDDFLDGGAGDDYLHGGVGSDTLYGRGGNDSLFGDDGDDLLDGGSDDDYLVGGSGHDDHNPGSEAGDTVGDRPSFSNFSFRYRGLDREVSVSGNIIDDESCADRSVIFSGIAQGSIPLTAAGAFNYIIAVPDLGNGWLYLDYTDAEGLQAQRMTIALT